MSDFPHPVLPCGFNSTAVGEDELNGSGVNWLIAPVLFDTFVGLVPLIITDEMLDVFDDTCPDFVIAADYAPISWPMEQQNITVGGAWATLALPDPANVITLPRGSRGITLPPEPDTAEISQENQFQIRRRA